VRGTSLTGLRVGATGAVGNVKVVVVVGNVITTGAGWNVHGATDWGKAYRAIWEGGQYNKAGGKLEK
jgi:hypothetical protein